MNNVKEEMFIRYMQELINNNTTDKWKVKAEYSTNDNDSRIITIQEQTGEKTVFFGECEHLFNYFMFDIYGLTIKECKDMSVFIGNLIGKSIRWNYNDETWQFIFKQFVNPQAIEYMDIRRVGYNATMQVVVNRIK